MRLSIQAELAQNYFQLRALDAQKRILDFTMDAFQQSLKLTQNRYEVGVAGQADVAVARTQLESTRAQSIDLDWQRGQYEHAIAVLMGQAPSQFSLPPAVFTFTLLVSSSAQKAMRPTIGFPRLGTFDAPVAPASFVQVAVVPVREWSTA